MYIVTYNHRVITDYLGRHEYIMAKTAHDIGIYQAIQLEIKDGDLKLAFNDIDNGIDCIPIKYLFMKKSQALEAINDLLSADSIFTFYKLYSFDFDELDRVVVKEVKLNNLTYNAIQIKESEKV